MPITELELRVTSPEAKRRWPSRVHSVATGLSIVGSTVLVAIGVAWIFGVRVFIQIRTGSTPVQLTALAGVAVTMLAVWGIAHLVRSAGFANREAETQRFLQNLSEASATFTYVLDMDSHKVVHCNNYLCQFIGYPEAKIIRGGLALMRKLTHPDDWPVALEHFADIEGSGDNEVREFEQRLLRADGEWRWVLFRQTVLERRPDGSARITRGTGQDITERKEVENAVRQGKEILDRVIDHAAVGMALVSPDGHWLRVNESLCDFLLYREWELLEIDFQTITHPDDLDIDLAYVQQMLEGTIKTYTMEKRYFRKDGEIVWASLSVSLLREADGAPMYFLSQILDITERKSHEEIVNEYSRLLEYRTLELDTANRQLQHLVSVDPLTGVFNRRMLEIRLADAFELAKKFERPIAVIMLDVDHFKKFNDQFGHVAGDEALCAVAKIIRATCRGGDVVARYGGEEFVVVCPDTNLDEATQLAERLRVAVKAFDLKPQSITCSFGVSALGPDYQEPQEVVELADTALYQAKANGRDQVCASMEERIELQRDAS